MEYARYGEEHKEIYETETSERSFEEETKLSGFSTAPVKAEGSSIAYDNAQEAWSTRYTHETIALGFSITEEAVEDNLYDSLSARYTKVSGSRNGIHQAGQSCLQHSKQRFLWQLYRRRRRCSVQHSAPNRWWWHELKTPLLFR
jgi:hypothetical protein